MLLWRMWVDFGIGNHETMIFLKCNWVTLNSKHRRSVYFISKYFFWHERYDTCDLCIQHVAQWYEDHNGMNICVALVAPVNEWIYMTIAMCCLRHAHLVLVVLCQIWWFALHMSAQLIYAHQGCTWAMFPTSWHRCWNDNPTCLCAFPQRPALSQHMASVDCRVMHGCQAWDSWSTAVVFLILYLVGGVWSLGTACMFSRARTFSHTHMLILCMRTFTHVYVCVFAQTRSLYLVPFF